MNTRNKTILASLARTANANSLDLNNPKYKGSHIIIDMTAVTATGSVVFKVQGKDDVTGKYYDLLEAAAITGVSTVVLKLYPGLLAAANLKANDVLPETFRVIATHTNAVAMTYSVVGNMLN